MQEYNILLLYNLLYKTTVSKTSSQHLHCVCYSLIYQVNIYISGQAADWTNAQFLQLCSEINRYISGETYSQVRALYQSE